RECCREIGAPKSRSWNALDRICRFRQPRPTNEWPSPESPRKLFEPSCRLLCLAFRLGCERFQERRARQRQFSKQIAERKRRVGGGFILPHGRGMHAGDASQLGFKMRNRSQIRII